MVEALSPTMRHIDASAELSGGFQLPSVHHYLIVDPEDQPAIHRQRDTNGKIATSMVPSGRILLDPPDIAVDVAAFLA